MGCGRRADGNNHVVGRATRQYVRKASSKCAESTVYRSFPPFPCSTRIVIRAESRSVTRRWITSFSRKPAAYVVRSIVRCLRFGVWAITRCTSARLKIMGSLPGCRIDGIVNAVRSRFNVV